MQGISRVPPEEWADIELARLLNRVLGVTTITPWNLGAIPDVWIALVVEGVGLKAELAEAGIGN